MNPRQRRGALLMILATLGAVVVFITIVGYVGSVRAEIGVKAEVLVLKQPINRFDPINPSAVGHAQVPRKYIPPTMITDLAELANQVAASDLPQGSYLQKGMLIERPVLQQGEREIAIMIDAETGVAGKVQPNTPVDIVATFQDQQGQNQRACAMRIIRNALVIQVGQLTSQPAGNGQAQADVEAVVPITFALTQAEAVELARAESFATKVRVALIGEQDQAQELEEAKPKPLPAVCSNTPR